MLKIKNLKKKYEESSDLVLKEINLEIEENEFLSIMGPSGSGKTTLLNAMSTIDNKYCGVIEYNGESIIKNQEEFRRNKMGFIFQDYNLIDTLDVFDNIALSLTLIGEKNVEERVKKISEILNIESHLKSYPTKLSGGQKQRVAIARALVKNPKILFCDEPTGALDSINSESVMMYLLEINKKLGVTIVMVTHDSSCAKVGNRVILLKDGILKKDIVRGKGETNHDYNIRIITSELGFGE